MIDEPISQFMNRDVLKGEPTLPLSTVVSEMNEGVHSALVVCEDDAPIGVITERDIVQLLDRSFAGESYDGVLARDVMTSPIHTLPETSTMGEVMRIMNERRFRRVPIVDDENRLSGIVNLMDLQSAMNRVLERRGRDLEVAVMERTAELEEANAQLEKLSVSDGLTGLLNRRAMSEKLDELHELSKRYGNDYSLILLDIDHFKGYNDTLGHVAGDYALTRVAKLLRDAIRSSDSAYRYGGEEFLILMPETDDESVESVAERIRSSTEALAIPHPDSSAGRVVTVSVGHTSVSGREAAACDSWKEIVETADRALYAAKQRGRNRVVGSNEIE